MRSLIPFLLFVFLAGSTPGQTRTSKTLDIYVVDVEGGNATLFVSPSGESVLIDTGNPGGNGRDAGRIIAAVKDASAKRTGRAYINSYVWTDSVSGVSEDSTEAALGLKVASKGLATARPT